MANINLEENIGNYYKNNSMQYVDPEIALNNIVKKIWFDLLDSGLELQDIDKILVEGIKKSDNAKFKQYIIYKKGPQKCLICGSKKEIRMHHKKHVASNPELEYDIDNVVFLCEDCHRVIHSDFENASKVSDKIKNITQKVFKDRLNEKIRKST